MQRGDGLLKIKSVIDALANPRAGDWVALDIDEVLLLTSLDKYEDPVTLTQKELVDAINMLKERGIRVFGITARKEKYKEETIRQLAAAGINLDYVLHAPNEKDADGKKKSTKGKVLRQHVESSEHKPRRLCIVDDLPDQLESVIESFKDSSTPLVCYHYERPEKQPVTLKRTKKAFPKTLSGYEVEKSLGGGTQSTFLLKNPDKTEKPAKHSELVLKLGAHNYGIKIEILCNAIYRMLGVNVPDLQVYNTLPKGVAEELAKLTSQYGIFSVSEYIKPGDLENAEELIKKDAREHFIAHVLLGNIDIAKEDNFIVDQNGKVVLIDAGANFIYRARGKYRKEAHHALTELETLRDEDVNEEAAEWFGSLTEDEIKNQVMAISKNIHKIERTVWYISNQLQLDSELREDFINGIAERLDCLIERYCPEIRAYPNQEKTPNKKQTAAGILTYTLIGDEYHVLLGKRTRHSYWANFGGKSDKNDKNLAETALREVAEESGQCLKYTEQALLVAPSHDLMRKSDDEKPFSYRMYFAEHDWINPDDIDDEDEEHTEYSWVPLGSLLAVANGNEDALGIEIYEPLLETLRQRPVKRNLERLLVGEAMLPTHTSGIAQTEASVEHKTRPIMTPTRLKQQMAETADKKSDVIAELKSLQPKELTKAVLQQTSLSQSEIHLKMLLGEEYNEKDLKANVEAVIEKYFAEKIDSEEAKAALIEKLTKFISAEKEDDSKVYFYHATNDKIEFVYDLYSAIFSILRSSPECQVMRMSSDKFHAFTNIAKFIAHFTKDGVIDNYEADYIDYAISANLFVFGNHARDSSCSIDYLIENETSTDISLKDILKRYFKIFELSSRDIKALKSIYKKHMKDSGGVLYQLTVDKEIVADYSYPSGIKGILNYLGEKKDIPDVIQQLREEAENNQMENKEYALELQARLLVKPTLPMIARRIKLNPARSPSAQAAYEADIKEAASTIVKAMLRSANNANVSAIRRDAPVIARLQDQHQLHGIPSAQMTSERYLLKCMLSGRIGLVKAILIKNPELRLRTIEFQRHINLLKKKHRLSLEEILPENGGKYSPFHMMLAIGCLKESNISDSDSDDENEKLDTAVIQEVYGVNWPNIAAEYADSFESLCGMIRDIPDDQQLEFVTHIFKHIDSYNKLKQVTDAVIYGEARLEIVKSHADKIMINNFKDILLGLGESQKIEFALFYINNEHSLNDVIAIIKKIECINDDLLQQLLIRISSFDDLLVALNLLLIPFRRKLLDKISKEILFSGDIRNIFDSLIQFPMDNYRFGIYLRDHSQRDGFILSLNVNDRDLLIKKLILNVVNIGSLRAALGYLPVELQYQLIKKLDKSIFLTSKESIIEFLDFIAEISSNNGDEYVLGLDADSKSLIIDYLKTGINNINELNRVLRCLPSDLRFPLIRAVDRQCLFSFLNTKSDISNLKKEIPQIHIQQLDDYLEIPANKCTKDSFVDFRLSMAYLNETLKKSSAPREQKVAACRVRDAFYQAACRNPDCAESELLNMAHKMRLVANVLENNSQLPSLMTSIQTNPVKHGQRKMAEMISGALIAFAGVSLCVAATATFFATGGLSAPASIAGFTIGVELLLAGLVAFNVINLTMSFFAVRLAYSGRQQGSAEALDEFCSKSSTQNISP